MSRAGVPRAAVALSSSRFSSAMAGQGLAPSGKVELVESYLGSKLGVAAGIFDRVVRQGSEPATTGRNDEQYLAQVRDLDGPPPRSGSAASRLGRQGNLAAVGDSELSDAHKSILPTTKRGEKVRTPTVTCRSCDARIGVNVERELVCQEDGRHLPLGSGAWRCPCGGLLDLSPAPALEPALAEGEGPSLWRWRHTFGLADDSAWRRVTLGEGGTPLVALEAERPSVLAKLDFLMPTLSFKDRGAAVLVTLAEIVGARRLIADSSGNAGTAIAAYASRADLPCEVFVPAATSPGKPTALRAHGATVTLVPGTREDAASAAIEQVEAAEAAEQSGVFYASHVYQPAFFEGIKTFAFEVWEQLGGRPPDEVIVPAGNGTLLLGIHIGFSELKRAGLIGTFPRLIAVQAAACNPLEAAWRAGAEVASPTANLGTAAEGIGIAAPARSRQILEAVRASGGRFVAVTEDAIGAARRELARMGLYVEPTAAATYAGLNAHLQAQPGERLIVWPVCGAGLKAP